MRKESLKKERKTQKKKGSLKRIKTLKKRSGLGKKKRKFNWSCTKKVGEMKERKKGNEKIMEFHV